MSTASNGTATHGNSNEMPTLFVWSTEDPALGPDAARWTEEYVEGPYRFEVLEGIGHWIAESAPDRFNALLLEHLKRA